MAKTKCYLDYKGASNLRIPYDTKKLDNIEQTVKLQLQAEGKDFTDIDAVSEKISELINSEQRTATQRMLNKTDTYLQAVEEVRDNGFEFEGDINAHITWISFFLIRDGIHSAYQHIESEVVA